MKTIQLFLVIFLISTFFNFLLAQGNEAYSVEVKTLDNASVNLKDYVKTGKITVIVFWTTWCSPCKKMLDNLMDFYPEWQDDYGVEVIAVSMDDNRTFPKVSGLVDTKGWEYTILCDPNNSSYQKLGFDTVVFTLLIDQNGNIVHQYTNYTDGDEYALEEKIMELSE